MNLENLDLKFVGYRDSRVWHIVWIVGMVLNLALPFISDPALYGIHPILFRWLILINGVILGLSGLFGMSPLKTSPGYTPPKE
jgi:hypothetical protein